MVFKGKIRHHCVYKPHSVCPLIHHWTHGLFALSSYSQQCCYEHGWWKIKFISKKSYCLGKGYCVQFLMFKFLKYNVIFTAKHTGHEENYTKISQWIITEGSTSGWRRVHIPRRSSVQVPPLLRALLWSLGANKVNRHSTEQHPARHNPRKPAQSDKGPAEQKIKLNE